MRDLYPVTIIQARYGGSYEGDAWCAFHCYSHEVPSDATADDITCFTFWTSKAAELVGRGSTPNDALADLIHRLDGAHA